MTKQEAEKVVEVAIVRAVLQSLTPDVHALLVGEHFEVVIGNVVSAAAMGCDSIRERLASGALRRAAL